MLCIVLLLLALALYILRFAYKADLTVALKNSRPDIIQGRAIQFLPDSLEYIGLCDKCGGHLFVVKLAVFEDLSLRAYYDPFQTG